jgi:hypothetical protein
MTAPESWDALDAAEVVEPTVAAVEEADQAGAPGTGLPEVDAAIADIAAAAGSPPAEQIGGYEAAHQRLQNALTAIEEG